jgi:hypothetical protein
MRRSGFIDGGGLGYSDDDDEVRLSSNDKFWFTSSLGAGLICWDQGGGIMKFLLAPYPTPKTPPLRRARTAVTVL